MVSEAVLVIKILEVVNLNQNFKKNKQQGQFFKRKKKGKSTRFSGKFISPSIEISWKLWSKLKTGMRTFNGSAEGGRKKEEKGQRIFILNQGRIENLAKSR